jgi:SAM-dependent methyltransferase
MSLSTALCKVCRSETADAGTVHGTYANRDFSLRRCHHCGFAFVADPWLAYDEIYDERYYAGRGADPLVDYLGELEAPDRSIRSYEWDGIGQIIRDLAGPSARVRWIDYGCGAGGLVRRMRAAGYEVVGYESSPVAVELSRRNVPVVEAPDLPTVRESFDVVTAIEVLEHTVDPVQELRTIRSLLRPGGLLFLTTGNAAPFAARLTRWSYVIPEIHISFFEPRTLDRALRLAEFRPEQRGLGPGFNEVLKFKVLKNLRARHRSFLTDALPSRVLALADRRTHLRDHPIGWAVESCSSVEALDS